MSTITAPVFLSVELLNGTRITGRVVEYSDPRNPNYAHAFWMKDSDGVETYVRWGASQRLIVTPLTVAPPVSTDD